MNLPVDGEMTSPAALTVALPMESQTPPGRPQSAADSNPDGVPGASLEAGQTTGSFAAVLAAESEPVDVNQPDTEVDADDAAWSSALLASILGAAPAPPPPAPVAPDLTIPTDLFAPTAAEADVLETPAALECEGSCGAAALIPRPPVPPAPAPAASESLEEVTASHTAWSPVETVEPMMPQAPAPEAGVAETKNAPPASVPELQALVVSASEDGPASRPSVEPDLAFAARLRESGTEGNSAAEERPAAATRSELEDDAVKALRPEVRVRPENDPMADAAQPPVARGARELFTAVHSLAEPAASSTRNPDAREVRPASVQIRTAEIELAQNRWSERPAGAAREISLRLSEAGQQPASVRLVDRSGELLVSVRSADPQLTQALRGELDQLARRLEDTGFKTEVWRPASAAQPSQADADSRESREYSNKQQQRQEAESGGQKRHGKPRPHWVEELENLSGR